VAETEARRLADWLPTAIRSEAQALFVEGRRVPQEALRLEVLAAELTSTAGHHMHDDTAAAQIQR
jgi:hypothetical protein